MTFDEYCAAVRDADVEFTLTHREAAPWQLEYSSLGIGSLQFGADGGGSVSDGKVPADRLIVVFKRSQAPAPIYLDGKPVSDTDLCFLGPGSRFVFSSQGPRNWLAATLNSAAVAEASRTLALLLVLEKRTWIVSASASEISQTLQLATLLRNRGRNIDCVTSRREYEGNLASDLLSMLARSKPERYFAMGPDAAPCVTLVHSALGWLRDSEVVNVRIDDLCSNLGVSARTLLRAFNRTVGVGPKKFLRLRQLNLIRRALRNRTMIEKRSITEILTTYGVSELGRAAGDYRILFGETPSETVKRSQLEDRQRGLIGKRERRPSC